MDEDRETDPAAYRDPAADRNDDFPNTDLELVGIVAVAENGVIGRDGEMPWHLPADLARFKRLTTDHPVIMGRVTYESIVAGLGEPLPDRTSIVLTSRRFETPEGVILIDGTEAAIEAAEEAARACHDGAHRAFVAGGASVYEQFMPVLDRVYLTEVEGRPEGDTSFSFDRSAWTVVSREPGDGYTFIEFVRRH